MPEQSAVPRQSDPTYPAIPPVAAPARTSGLAITALIFGIIPFLAGLLGIVLGIVALGDIRRNGRKGKGLAVAGIVTGSFWLVVVGVAVVIGLIMAAQGGQLRPARAAASPPVGVSSPDVTFQLGHVHTGDLRRFLPPAPANSKPWKTPLGTNEQLSLEQAAEFASNADSRANTLRRYNFVQGAVRCWHDNKNNIVDVRLYQFDSVEDAKYFGDFDINATSAKGYAPRTGPLATFADDTPDKNGYVRTLAIGYQGDVVYVVEDVELPPADATVVSTLAKSINEALLLL